LGQNVEMSVVYLCTLPRQNTHSTLNISYPSISSSQPPTPLVLTTPLILSHIVLSFPLNISMRKSSHPITALYLLCLFPRTSLNAFKARNSTCALLTAHLYPSLPRFLLLLFINTNASSIKSVMVPVVFVF